MLHILVGLFYLQSVNLLNLSLKILKVHEAAILQWTWMAALSVSSLQTDGSTSCRHTLGLCIYQNEAMNKIHSKAAYRLISHTELFLSLVLLLMWTDPSHSQIFSRLCFSLALQVFVEPCSSCSLLCIH